MMKRKTVPPPEPVNNTLIDLIEARQTALSVPELAEMFSISKQKIYQMINDGRLPAFRIDTCLRLDPQTTAAWLRQRFSR